MRSVRRPAGIACIVGALALLFLNSPALAQANITVLDSGTSGELVAPPAPSCNDLVFITEVSFTDGGVPIGVPRMGVGPGLVTSYLVPGFQPIGPSIVALNEVITFDGHAGRDIWPAQLNERVRFEFLLDGQVQVATPFTPDVPDGAVSAWLDIDMGVYELPNGADALRIVHFADPDNTDSVIVSALCGTRSDIPATTTTTTVGRDDATVTDDCDDADNDAADRDAANDDCNDATKPCNDDPTAEEAQDETCNDDAATDDCDDPANDDAADNDAANDDCHDATNDCDDAANDDAADRDAANDDCADDTTKPCNDDPTAEEAQDETCNDEAATDDDTATDDDAAGDDDAATDNDRATDDDAAGDDDTATGDDTATDDTTTDDAPVTDDTTTDDADEDVDVEVEGKVEEQDTNQLLAVTGTAYDLGLSLIAAGLLILGCALLLQSKDVEEIFA